MLDGLGDRHISTRIFLDNSANAFGRRIGIVLLIDRQQLGQDVFGLGIAFTLFPHFDLTHTGIVSHGTGAELVGVGVSSIGSGVSLFLLDDAGAALALELVQ